MADTLRAATETTTYNSPNVKHLCRMDLGGAGQVTVEGNYACKSLHASFPIPRRRLKVSLVRFLHQTSVNNGDCHLTSRVCCWLNS